MFLVQFTSHNFCPSFVLLYENVFNYPNALTIAAVEADVDVEAKRCPILFEAVNEVRA